MEAPRNTYRLQVRPTFTLDDAAAQAGYLARLGVDALYLSPVLSSTAGSDHGYDGTDPTTIDAGRGGETGWTHLVEAAQRAGLRLVLDIVPNHLGISEPAQNPSWWSVLAEGESSPYASWYDIDWSRPITIPVLSTDEAISDLHLVEGDTGWELHYWEHRFPVAENTATAGDDPQAVHQRQHYRLIDWRRANAELSYRRFFAVNSLAGLRVEDDQVFAATHGRIVQMCRDGQLLGLRVDHPDGLLDPGEYFTRLAEAVGDRWIVAEKILEGNEELPDWPIAGTTGYDAMAELNAVLIDPQAEQAFTSTYHELTRDTATLALHQLLAKDEVARTLFTAEFRRIAAALPAPLRRDDRTVEALRAIARSFTVYRSYLPDRSAMLRQAIAEAIELEPELAEVITECGDRLLDPEAEAALRFQQITGPVLAKGLEDTAWYRYSRFIGLNEVGGDPGQFGCSVAQFHDQWRVRAGNPKSMIALSTHDTKRGEDVRARLACLSEIPQAWHHLAENFMDAADELGGLTDRRFIYLLAQTFAGVGLIERDRMHAYAEKAMREAAVATSWDAPEADYEHAVHRLVDACYDDASLRGLIERLSVIIEQPGWSNALAQKLLALTGPGVPDVYAGTEVWEDSLVDPDNRRPVDFAALSDRLRGLDAHSVVPPVDRSGDAKLWVTSRALRLRTRRPEWFTGYWPVTADGPAADHFLGFNRGQVITAVTRLPLTLSSSEHGWGDTVIDLAGPGSDLAGTSWTDALTGEAWNGTVRLADLFAHLPVALLVRS